MLIFERPIHFSNLIPRNDLAGRTFKTFDFYKTYQDDITPAGLAFFQSSWEPSLKDFYHNVLGIFHSNSFWREPSIIDFVVSEMKEPTYEYDFPKPYIRDQMYFPLRQPFNLYLDKYRDQKEVGWKFIFLWIKGGFTSKIGVEPRLKFNEMISLWHCHTHKD